MSGDEARARLLRLDQLLCEAEQELQDAQRSIAGQAAGEVAVALGEVPAPPDATQAVQRLGVIRDKIGLLTKRREEALAEWVAARGEELGNRHRQLDRDIEAAQERYREAEGRMRRQLVQKWGAPIRKMAEEYKRVNDEQLKLRQLRGGNLLRFALNEPRSDETTEKMEVHADGPIEAAVA